MQTVTDRRGNEIYVTDERLQHIAERHSEMAGFLDRIVEVLKKGKRKQDALDPVKYKYTLSYNDLSPGYNTLVVVVKFGFDSEGKSNNFVLTAYQVDDH